MDEDNQRRQEISKYYRKNIKNKQIILPETPKEESHVWHLFVIRTENRTKLQKYLSDNGIQTMIHYPIAPHKQKAYKELNTLALPITEKIHKEVLSLPISPVMNDEEIKKVVEVINKYEPD